MKQNDKERGGEVKKLIEMKQPANLMTTLEMNRFTRKNELSILNSSGNWDFNSILNSRFTESCRPYYLGQNRHNDAS